MEQLDVCTYICIVKLEEAIKTTKFSSQKQKAGLNILYTAWWLKTVITGELKKIGLTNEQFNVLRILKGKHPEHMCVRDIGSRMIEPSSNVPRIIDRLVLKQYVERSTSELDKRETVIRLTKEGLNVLETASKKVDTVMDAAIGLGEQEAVQIHQLLELLREKK
jgi:DNA-binding MarR family transcriptional regulator